MQADVIVIGGGHAGVEAALAACRMGAKTILVSMALDAVGLLACNPSFGGPAKGGLVREVDALGGLCGFMADQCAIHCRTLGESKGPAARSTRVLVDRELYCRSTLDFLRQQVGLTILEGEGADILSSDGHVSGIMLADGRKLEAPSLVLAGGTFWRAFIHRGHAQVAAGRRGEPSCRAISQSLINLGHRAGKLSTCTAPRLKAGGIDLSRFEEQPGDPSTRPFSMLHDKTKNTASCYGVWTNPRTHQIVSDALPESIFRRDDETGAAPRYCPSIEDKIVHYPTRDRHHIFLEPDGQGIIFPSGIPTGLSSKTQAAMINSIEGLERAEIAWYGYAVEYDYFDPRDLSLSLESLHLQGLFLAGQINGTSGYEEAAAQGLMAGIGAARRAGGAEPETLPRTIALSGVMLDDLTVRGVNEPYRMFTSRAEWRLLLREDNADLRLAPLAEKWGILDAQRASKLRLKQQQLKDGWDLLRKTRISPAQSQVFGREALLLKDGGLSAAELLKRPEASLKDFFQFIPALESFSAGALATLETEVKFEGYISRQEEEVARLKRQESLAIPSGMDFLSLSGLSAEVKEILASHRPSTLGQAGRLSGMTPAALSVLAIHLKALNA